MKTQETDTSEFQDTTVSDIEWRDGQPYSTRFQDIYFSNNDGLAETEYVFIQSNNLPSRFQQLDSPEFIIIETGFGTGLNFLCAARLWLSLAPANATLFFISTEKYPLTLADIKTSLSLWPDLNGLSHEFLAAYQDIFHGIATLSLFDNRVQLTLLLGDAAIMLSNLNIKADAWFLDGFAPAKNPEMWQTSLFSQMARLSKPATTFSTFTSAGIVKRGLQAAGFEVNKQPGFGKKREMLTGHYVN